MPDMNANDQTRDILDLIDEIKVSRVFEHLILHWDIKRPPELSARLLTLLVELYKRGLPYPPRAEVADALGAPSPFGIDAAINRAMERGMLSVEIRTEEGNASKRTNVVMKKFYKPSKELLEVVDPPTYSREKRKA
jgi:hypothetical protein